MSDSEGMDTSDNAQMPDDKNDEAEQVQDIGEDLKHLRAAADASKNYSAAESGNTEGNMGIVCCKDPRQTHGDYCAEPMDAICAGESQQTDQNPHMNTDVDDQHGIQRQTSDDKSAEARENQDTAKKSSTYNNTISGESQQTSNNKALEVWSSGQRQISDDKSAEARANRDAAEKSSTYNNTFAGESQQTSNNKALEVWGSVQRQTSDDKSAEARGNRDAAEKSSTYNDTFSGESQQTSNIKALEWGSVQHHTSDDKSAERHGVRRQTSDDKSAEKDEDQVIFWVSVKWSEGAQPRKAKVELQLAVQTWANKRVNLTKLYNVEVLQVSDDGRAEIRITPAPAVSELQKLHGQTLTRKDEKTVMITSVSLTPPKLEIQTPDRASVSRPPSVPDPQHERNDMEGSNFTSGEEFGCVVPTSHFWYVSHIYKEEMKRIEKRNGVKFAEEVKVSFVAAQKDGNQQQALNEFTNLVQKCIGESEGSVFPLQRVDQEDLKDTLKIIHKKENKLLVSLSSEEMIAFGPRQSQDAISLSLNAKQKTLMETHPSFEEATLESEDLLVGLKVEDPLLKTGLTMDESLWKLMTTSFASHLVKIKDRFGVDLNESGTRKGNVEVKVHYKRSGGNPSMESHAIRALLHLLQKIVTSPMNPQLGSAGISGSLSNVYPPGRASNVPQWDDQSGRSTGNTKVSTGEGAAKGENKEENCPICMDTFTNKTQLGCKHEFCEDCLRQAVQNMGQICPLCKDVFGKLEGNQPDGTMSFYRDSFHLPGFTGCGTITITYDIPGGTQTKKHPHPGQSFHGARRSAYLPDNKEGNEVLQLLRRAFDQKLIFTVGTSRTSGMDNQVTWNDIHHKTSTTGGAQNFGYPDPAYLSRVKDELKAKGIK